MVQIGSAPSPLHNIFPAIRLSSLPLYAVDELADKPDRVVDGGLEKDKKPSRKQKERQMPTAVEEKVKQIIVEQLGVDEGEVTPNASFVDDLGADSLDTVELVMAFEEAFDIEIPDEQAEKIRTVKDAIDYINTHSKGK